MTVGDLWLFLTVPWVGLRCVIMVFPDNTHLLFLWDTVNSTDLAQAQIFTVAYVILLKMINS